MSSVAACSALSSDGDSPATGTGEIMLFGVRVVVDSMRKSVSMNNLSQYEHPQDASNSNKEDSLAADYGSANEAVPHNSSRHRERERKRGVPWTEEEHKLFLFGLQKVGKGDWRGISRNYVKTRTPTQVASHAQKYFLRRSNLNRRRRRSSLFDITTDAVPAIPVEEEQIQQQDNVSYSHPACTATLETSNINGFSVMPLYPMGIASGVIPAPIGNPMENLTLGQGNMEFNESTKLVRSIPDIADPKASTFFATSSSPSIDPPTLSLRLSLSSEKRDTSSTHSSLHVTPCFNNGDSVISVA